MRSQSSIAYEKIKEMIFRFELLPGARISEVQIAKKLSLSRTPVHDALRRLASEGLVRIEANKCATVSEFSDEEIEEIGAVRLSLDLLSQQLASYYGSAADFDNLDKLAEKCEQASSKGDMYERIRKDCDFHLAISEVTKNQKLIKQQREIYQQIYLIQISKYTDIEHSMAQICQHKPLVAAMRKRDLEQIRSLTYQHLAEFFCLNSYLPKGFIAL
ncbi:MAG: GntR family transcriptional regulator [Clostridia bacterium]|jgi:DNA-binding GntR family transcriptional regulator|nr:GntR family transcriptional regulator [Clostridia bacterium]MCI2014339.1 GntR family transcriptional regulator [Clostridia bacterium]